MKKIYILFAIMISTFVLNAQDYKIERSPFSFGVFGGANYSVHSADFYNLPGMNSFSELDDKTFTGGNGLYPSFGLFVNYRFGDWFVFELQGLYQPISVDMETTVPIGLQEYNGKLVQLSSKKTLSPKLEALTINPFFYYSPKQLPELKFGLSPEINILFGKTYSFKEELVVEDGVDAFYFQEQQSKLRQEIPDGTEIKDASSISFNLALAMGYSFRFAKIFEITPTASFSMGLSNLAQDVNWKYNAFRFGIAVGYRSADVIIPIIKECPKGYIYDDVKKECVAKVCPTGYELNYTTGECELKQCPPAYVLNMETGECELKQCPPAYNLDEKTGECILKTCPPAYNLDMATGECVLKTCPNGYLLDTITGECMKTCPEGMILSTIDNECKPADPKIDENCKGTFLAVSSFKKKEDAEKELSDLKEAGFLNFRIELLTDAVNKKNKFYSIVTTCYGNDEDAIIAMRELTKVLAKKGFKRTLELREK